MLRYPQPVPYGPRERVSPKLGPYRTIIQQVLWQKVDLRGAPLLSARKIYEHIHAQGYSGSYGTARNYVATLKPTHRAFWEAAYDHIRTLDRRSAVTFLMRMAHRARSPEVKNARGQPEAIAEAGSHHVDSVHHGEAKSHTAFTWMRKVLQKTICGAALRHELGDVPDLDLLLTSLYEAPLSGRNRSLAVLASIRGWPAGAICSFLCISDKTCQAYVQTFSLGGAAALLGHRPAPNRKVDSEVLKNLIFTTLHEPPMSHGFNRTTWTMAMVSQVLSNKGQPACRDTIRKITRQAGWRWRKAREVLTSSDPEYAEKLQRVRSTLSGLQPDEAFFSIDEFGPFSVKLKGGRALTPPGIVRTVPQWQKSRGSLIITAALELSSNQITHFYSEKKNSAEMIRMAEILIKAYPTYRTLYLSWDAASWHTSKQLNEWIVRHNASAHLAGTPTIMTVPLPSNAQFLNVIESVFSGMARGVIHNSNYIDPNEAKAAIDCYFAERNAHFQSHPKQAGDKIWRNERVTAKFSEANSCKDPCYR
jgi:transposase